jgi:hypothetical protein
MLHAKTGQYWMLSVTIVLSIATFLLNRPAVVAAGGPPKRCGEKTARIPWTGYVWTSTFLYPTHTTYLSAESLQTRKKVFTIDKTLQASDFQLSSDGQALAFFTRKAGPLTKDRGTALVALKVVTRQGKQFSVPAASNWWTLGPELRPGYFGVLSYDDNFYATLLEVPWRQTPATIRLVERLPFKIPIAASLWEQIIQISPNWDYVAFMGDDGHYHSQFTIYAMKQQRVLWQTTEYVQIPLVIWDPASTNAVACTVEWGSDSHGDVVLVNPQGQSMSVANLNTWLGEKAQLTAITSTLSPDHQLAFTVFLSVSEQYKTLVLNTLSHALIDLCFPTNSITMLWADKVLLLDDADAAYFRRSILTIMSPATGVYAVQPYEGKFWIPLAWVKGDEHS